MRRRVLLIVAGVLASVLVAASCGVSGSGDFQALDRDDLERSGLLDTTSTTTTTTTTTTLPSTTTPQTVPTTMQTTTTLALEPLGLYFIAGNRLTPVVRAFPRPASPAQVLAALMGGPPADAGVGLRTALPPDTFVTVDVAGGVATVNLLGTAVTQIAADQLPLAFGQLVLSLELRGIGAVKFLVDGIDTSVPKGDGSLTPVGGTVTFDDYQSLRAG